MHQMCEVYESNIYHLEGLILEMLASYIKKVRALCKEYPECRNHDYCYDCRVGKVIALLESVVNGIPSRVQDIIDFYFVKK